MTERMFSCQECGMLVPAERPVFHPHVYCMLYRAGVREPERYMKATMALLNNHFGAPAP